MTCRLAVAFVGLCATTPLAAAPSPTLDLPAGSFGGAVAALGRQAGISVAVDDAALWSRPVPALRGRVPTGVALRRLLAGTGARAIEVRPGLWRVRPAPVTPREPPPRAAVADAIVVTASKRDLRLSDFAGTVERIDGRELVAAGPRGTEAILSRLASVSSTYLGAGRNKLFIRGIADSSFTGPTQATVGQYIGDLRLTYNAPDPDLRLYDIADVEVLEGPQGTLYGAGSLGGIIRLTPAAPDLRSIAGSVTAGVSATHHGEPGCDMSAMLNLPLDDTRGVRLVGYRSVEGGYIDNVLTGRRDVNRTTTTGGRGALRVEIPGGWTADFGAIVQRIRGADSQYAQADAPRLTRSSPVAEPFGADYSLFQTVVAKDWDDIRFRSTTGYARQRLSENFDATAPGAPPAIFHQANDTRLFSTEERVWRPVGPHTGWLLGASYTRNRSRLDRAIGPVDQAEPITGVINIAEDVNVYGEASLRLTSWLLATAGGRISRTRLSGGALHVPPAALTDVAIRALDQITQSRGGTSYLPSIALAAHATSALTLFVRYQQSFRPGGLTADRDLVRRFRNDRVETVETGLRLTHSGRTGFDVAVSGSYTFWRDIQADFVDDAGFVVTDNIGDGRIWSASANGAWYPVPDLRLEAAFTFNDGRVTRPAATVDLSPAFADPLAPPVRVFPLTRIPNVARVAARLGAVWETTLPGRLSLRAEVWGRYVGRSRLGEGPVLGRTQGDYPDSAATVRVGTRTAGVTLGISNLSDSVGNRFALGTPFLVGYDQITPLRPRTIRIALDASF